MMLGFNEFKLAIVDGSALGNFHQGEKKRFLHFFRSFCISEHRGPKF